MRPLPKAGPRTQYGGGEGGLNAALEEEERVLMAKRRASLVLAKKAKVKTNKTCLPVMIVCCVWGKGEL